MIEEKCVASAQRTITVELAQIDRGLALPAPLTWPTVSSTLPLDRKQLSGRPTDEDRFARRSSAGMGTGRHLRSPDFPVIRNEPTSLRSTVSWLSSRRLADVSVVSIDIDTEASSWPAGEALEVVRVGAGDSFMAGRIDAERRRTRR
jgi:hypothetical protein